MSDQDDGLGKRLSTAHAQLPEIAARRRIVRRIRIAFPLVVTAITGGESRITRS